MTSRGFAVFVLTAALALGAATGMSAQGKGHENGKSHPHASKAGDDDRWERRGDYEYRTYDRNEGQPPGWSKGKKTGWGNCDLPPGQAKKYGCRSYVYGGRTHYYYRDDQGRIIVRRPVIRDRDGERH